MKMNYNKQKTKLFSRGIMKIFSNQGSMIDEQKYFDSIRIFYLNLSWKHSSDTCPCKGQGLYA